MALGIYAGTSAANVVELPSPESLKVTHELIWDQDTGRAQSGVNKAKMIGSVVDEKRTYAIQWGILTDAELTTIKGKLTKNFFYFAVATTLNNAKSAAVPFYRGEISGTYLPIGDTIYHKDVTVTVIEQ